MKKILITACFLGLFAFSSVSQAITTHYKNKHQETQWGNHDKTLIIITADSSVTGTGGSRKVYKCKNTWVTLPMARGATYYTCSNRKIHGHHYFDI